MQVTGAGSGIWPTVESKTYIGSHDSLKSIILGVVRKPLVVTTM